MKILVSVVILLASAVAGWAQEDDPYAAPVAGETFTRLGNLRWAPGALNNITFPNNASQSDPAAITHTLSVNRTGITNRKVVLGFNKFGGGYDWSAKMFGFIGVANGTESGTPGYGRGMLGSIRDFMHFGDYNPIRSGWSYDIGVETKVIPRDLYVWTPQMQASLWDKGDNDLANHASEFDFSAITRNESDVFSFPVVAFSDQQYYVWARNAAGITQFPLDAQWKITDISDVALSQRPTNTDMSFVNHTLKGLRPPLSFKYLWYRQNAAWVTKTLDNIFIWRCVYRLAPERTLQRTYTFTDSRPVPMDAVGREDGQPDPCDLDYPIFILSTSATSTEGSAIGLYVPTRDPMNALQTKVIDSANKVVSHQEDRRLTLYFQVSDERDDNPNKPDIRYFLARQHLTGLLQPTSAQAVHGANKFEALTQKTFVLYGTVNQVFVAARDHHNSYP